MRKFIVKTLNGMAYGLFATLLIGVILQQVGKITGIGILENELYDLLSGLMGVGIGLGIGLVLEKDGLQLVMSAVVGGIATTFATVVGFSPFDITINPVVGAGNPVTTYFVVVFTLLLNGMILKKKTPVDIILVPLLMILIGLGLTLVLSYPLDKLVYYIQVGIERATIFSPFMMSIAVAVSMGMLLTSPISSAAVSFAVILPGSAAGAAVVGTSIQMIGFAVQSIKDNKIGEVISVAIGTSMLQFKNIIKKPIIWLPTIISSAIIAPIVTLGFDFQSTPAGAGMGTAGLVGILQSLDYMEYSLNSILGIVVIVVAGGGLVFAIDLLMRKFNLITDGDFYIGEGL